MPAQVTLASVFDAPEDSQLGKRHTPAGSLLLAANVDIVACRQLVRKMAVALGFTVTGQTMLVTAASELARNTLIHGGGGWFTWQVLEKEAQRGIRLAFESKGSGIPDVDLARTAGTRTKAWALGYRAANGW